jgi:hypothetical protein
MSKKLFLMTLMLTVGIYVCTAAKIDGKWKTTMNDMELTFSFKVTGDTFSGSVLSQMGDMPFTNGKIKGDEYTFDIDMQGAKITHKFKLDGDVIKMTVVLPADMGGGAAPSEMILKKVEEK